MNTATAVLIEAHARRTYAGSEAAMFLRWTDEELRNEAAVRSATTGLGWQARPEENLRAAAAELEWRRENNLSFGWHSAR